MIQIPDIHTGRAILIRNKLSEIKIDDYIKWMKARQRDSEITRDIEFHQFDIQDAFGVNYLHEVTEEQQKEQPKVFEDLFNTQASYLVEKLECMSDMLKALAASDLSAREIDNLPESMLPGFVEMLELEVDQEYEASAQVHIPGVNSDQINDMEEEIKELDSAFDAEKIHRYQGRIAKLKEHTLVLKPVKDAIFASYMRASSIEQAIPQQDKELFTKLEEEGINPQEYEQNRAEILSNTQTLKERKDLMTRDQLVRAFLATAEQNFVARIPELISLFLVPEYEPFSMYYTKKREVYIRELDMQQLLGLINFIEAVLYQSNLNTAIFSPSSLIRTSKTNPSLLQSASTILESMGGSRLSEMF